MTWKPSLRPGVDTLALPLDTRQGYLLSRLDGTLNLPELATLMNLGEGQVAGMLAELVALGAVQPEISAAPEPEPGEDADVMAGLCLATTWGCTRGDEEGVKRPGGPPSFMTEEDSPAAAARATTHRARFEQQLHARPVDERVAQARMAVEPDLSAFCFDPTAEVIRAVLENPRVGLGQARLIAAHHRTAAGLEALGGRTAFTNDGGVRRGLLQNPLLPVGLYRRLWSPRRLLEQYLVATAREAPEQIRAMARDLLRASFNQRTGEERAELILTTEGRCLASLVGLTLDGHTTALLCRRTYVSTLLIQNIARWSAAPPPLIAHLRRQDVVKRNTPLRQLLERHPNAG